MVLDHRTILRTLKGAPLACLIALFMPDIPQPAGERWFARRTGYTRKTCREALYTLHELGYCDHGPRGWILPSGVKQLPLPFVQLSDEEGLSESEGKIYPHATTTATATIGREIELTAAAAASEGKIYPHGNGEGKIYPHGHKLSPDLSTTNCDLSTAQQAISDYLHSRGIGAPTCHTLAQLPWMTVAYARAHIDAGMADGAAHGLIIHRMKSHDPAPAGDDEPPPCPDCGRALFDRAGRCRVCCGQITI